MKLLFLFENFGPYHLARINAAATMTEVVGVQFHSSSLDYQWQVCLPEHIPIVTLKTSKTYKFSRRKMKRHMFQVLTDLSPDVVFIPGWSSREALHALIWCLINNIPAVLMSESSAQDEQRTQWKEWIKQQIVSCYASALVGGSLHKNYLTQLGMPEDLIEVGYDVVDNRYFQFESARYKKCQTNNVPFFLACARFIEKKNLKNLLYAYADYLRMSITYHNNTPWGLVLLGDGELAGEIQQLILKLKIQNYVKLPGFVQYNEIPKYFGNASAFIHVSSIEQWGLVVNEAMASSLPVIVSKRCGCVPELVMEGKNGFLIDPYNTSSITQAMWQMSKLSYTELDFMGQMSVEIIKLYCPERFASGAFNAAKKAIHQFDRIKPSWWKLKFVEFLQHK